MTDESYGFTAARARLDEIVTQVRKKDMSLEASLDLLEEGVKLANQCTELIDHVDWTVAQASPGSDDTDTDVPSAEDAAVEGTGGAQGEEPAPSSEADEDVPAVDDQGGGQD